MVLNSTIWLINVLRFENISKVPTFNYQTRYEWKITDMHFMRNPFQNICIYPDANQNIRVTWICISIRFCKIFLTVIHNSRKAYKYWMIKRLITFCMFFTLLIGFCTKKSFLVLFLKSEKIHKLYNLLFLSY